MKEKEYNPPKIWKWDSENGGKFANINRPTAGKRFDSTLPTGKHPLQLYSMGTPNGAKVTILLEELLEIGIKEAEYDAYLIDIFKGEQFGSGFVDINPNSKIPALVDNSGEVPIKIFESGAILLYLAQKFGKFFPQDKVSQAECTSWLFWQMGSTPYLGGGFGHFYAYAPYKQEYPINRFAMETKRQLDVLDKRLEKTEFISGSEYSIADIAIFPWYGGLAFHGLYNAKEFLDLESYENVIRWGEIINTRPAVIRGKRVNKTWGPEAEQLKERHSGADFEQS